MRRKDETKKQRIIDCLLKIVKDEGFTVFIYEVKEDAEINS